jgi:hypothetical protein
VDLDPNACSVVATNGLVSADSPTSFRDSAMGHPMIDALFSVI